VHRKSAVPERWISPRVPFATASVGLKNGRCLHIAYNDSQTRSGQFQSSKQYVGVRLLV
jgi:hypothetical protein